MKQLFIVFPLLALAGCQSASDAAPVRSVGDASIHQQMHGLRTMHQNASPAGSRVLAIGRDLALVKKEVVRGGCWDFIDRVYTDAGFPRSSAKRLVIHKGSKQRGPYAAADQIKAGDWLYYVNHSYGEMEHSGIFVGWEDKARKQGLILSYAGEQRNQPARYRTYDLSNVYRITRPVE